MYFWENCLRHLGACLPLGLKWDCGGAKYLPRFQSFHIQGLLAALYLIWPLGLRLPRTSSDPPPPQDAAAEFLGHSKSSVCVSSFKIAPFAKCTILSCPLACAWRIPNELGLAGIGGKGDFLPRDSHRTVGKTVGIIFLGSFCYLGPNGGLYSHRILAMCLPCPSQHPVYTRAYIQGNFPCRVLFAIMNPIPGYVCLLW